MPGDFSCTPGCELKATNVRVQALSIGQIKLNRRNSRTHSAKQIRQIANSMVAFGVELLIGDDEVFSPGDLVAAASVLRRDRHAGFFIDQLLAQAMAGGLVNLPECDALGRRARRMQRNRIGDQSKFEIAFPVGTHDQLLWVYACDAVCKDIDALFDPLAR
jgi:hypothetical protein